MKIIQLTWEFKFALHETKNMHFFATGNKPVRLIFQTRLVQPCIGYAVISVTQHGDKKPLEGYGNDSDRVQINRSRLVNIYYLYLCLKTYIFSVFQVTISILVPPIMLFLVQHSNVSNYDLSSLRLIPIGGADISVDIIKKLLKRLNNRHLTISGGKKYRYLEHLYLNINRKRLISPKILRYKCSLLWPR